MSSRVALPVLIWSISAAGAEEPSADPPVVDLAVDIVRGTTRPDKIQDAELNGFERRALLSGVSLAIASGEVVALVGPNGAGKSTLLGVLAGLRRPSGGGVWLYGRALRDYDVAWWEIGPYE